MTAFQIPEKIKAQLSRIHIFHVHDLFLSFLYSYTPWLLRNFNSTLFAGLIKV